ncbi:MAG: SAM-dependent chlorinase/fluorinase [Lachnospiraceae bacterium]|nr:SAM-dependent chlorinase/fluorinase [Lachnospiraceae bacterium]
MKPSIVWQTDFGLKWGAVASMRGVCKQVDPELECYDLTHEIPQYNILAGSRELIYVEPFWPKGTIFVSVVDPGVGTSRRACVALLKDGNYVVTPDNGSLTHVAHEVGIREVREIDETVNRYPGTEGISVFHGRDLFAYTAARLASGIIDFEGVGPRYPVEEVVLLPEAYEMAVIKDGVVSGFVSSVSDPFGSIALNVASDAFKEAGFAYGDKVHVVLKNKGETYYDDFVAYEKSFGFVEVGDAILFDSSSNVIELGINQGNFKETFHVCEGSDYGYTLSK